MLSRNRSTSGVPGYVRATCNPDADSWVRKFVDWWIGDDGYPVAKRSGVLRWFIRLDDRLIWADTRDELVATYGPESLPKSVTFIPSKVHDNRILMEKDPSYLANLRALNRVDRLRLEGGNWNVRATAGMLFQREWFRVLDAVPGGWTNAVRFWDRAASVPTPESPDPDWTRGLKLLRYPNGTYLVADLRSAQDRPGRIEDLIKNVASHDGPQIRIMSQQDPGSAGVGEAEHFIRMLAGYDVRTEVMPRDKITRAKPVSAQAEGGSIYVLRAPWNDAFFAEVENFGEECKHDDIVDTLSGAFNHLSGSGSLLDHV